MERFDSGQKQLVGKGLIELVAGRFERAASR